MHTNNDLIFKQCFTVWNMGRDEVSSYWPLQIFKNFQTNKKTKKIKKHFQKNQFFFSDPENSKSEEFFLT